MSGVKEGGLHIIVSYSMVVWVKTGQSQALLQVRIYSDRVAQVFSVNLEGVASCSVLLCTN